MRSWIFGLYRFACILPTVGLLCGSAVAGSPVDGRSNAALAGPAIVPPGPIAPVELPADSVSGSNAKTPVGSTAHEPQQGAEPRIEVKSTEIRTGTQGVPGATLVLQTDSRLGDPTSFLWI